MLPEAERQHYAEKVWDLPCIVPYMPQDQYSLTGTSKAPWRKDDDETFTFGVSSRFEKLSDRALATWAAILQRCPDSRIIFKDRALVRPYCIKRIWNAVGGGWT